MKPRMSVARCCCRKGVTPPPPPTKILTNWIDWNWDETNSLWQDSYAAGIGVLGRFDSEPVPAGHPNWPSNVAMRRNTAGTADVSSLNLSSGQQITSAVITLTQANTLAASLVDFIGDIDVQDEDDPPSANTYTAQQINLWAAAPQGPIFYTLPPAYQATIQIDVTLLVQHVIDRAGFAGNNLNFRLTTRTNQPNNGPNSSTFGASIVDLLFDPLADSFLEITL